MNVFSTLNSSIAGIMLIMLPIAGMMLVFYSGYQLWRDLRGADKRKVLERLKEERVRQKVKTAQGSLLRSSDSNKLYSKIVEQISLAKKVQRWVEQSNLPISGAKLLVNLFLGTSLILAVGLLVKIKLWVVVLLAAAVLILPILAVRILARRRIKKLINQLPDVFELISQALRAGHSLASGIELVGKQLGDPAGTEFIRIFHEQNLGIKIEDALKNFADRVDQLDVRFFVTAVLIQRQTGGDLAEILDKIGAVIRDRIKIMGQVKALTAEGRMSGYVLCALPVLVFFIAWTLNPDYANVLLFEREGQLMLGAACFFQIVGMLMIKKIVTIKV